MAVTLRYSMLAASMRESFARRVRPVLRRLQDGEGRGGPGVAGGAPGARESFARYAAAALLAALGLVLARTVSAPLAGLEWAVPLAATCLAGALGGSGPGLAAAALSIAGSLPSLPHAVAPGYHPERIATFALASLLIGAAAGLQRSALRRRGQAEALARDRLDDLRATIASLAEGVCTLDLEGRLTSMNPAMERMLGWSQAELSGRRVHPLVHARRPDGSTLPEEACPLLGVLRTGRPRREEEEYLTRKDGSLVPVSCIAVPIRKGGKVKGLILAFQDFTGRRLLPAASRLLDESSDPDEALRRVARLAARGLGCWCAVAVLDPDGRPRLVAAEAAGGQQVNGSPDLLGEHGLGRILRTGDAEFSPSIPEGTGEGRGGARSAILPGVEVTSFMGLPLRAQGRLLGGICFALAGSPRRFDEHDFTIGEELARRCAAFLGAAEYARSLEEAKRAREEALAVASHELRGPLNNILVSSSALERQAPEGPGGDAARRASRLITRSATRLTRLATDLLDFASIEAGRLTVTRAPQDAASIAREAIDAFRPTADERGVRLASDLAPEALTVDCDRDRIIQVLSNLLSNAIEATRRGEQVVVTVSEEDHEAVFSVTDVGPGIRPDELPSLFDRYSRGRSARYRGAGLGLAIARSIVELHGGRIWAESTPGQGSAFRFRLPAMRTGPRPDILVVDDDADIRVSLKDLLEIEGYEVALAANGREAWEQLRNAPPPALILLDLMMPVMNGSELLGLVRADGRLRSVPVYLVTAFGSLAEPVAARSEGLLTKPLDIEQVLGLASRYCAPRPEAG